MKKTQTKTECRLARKVSLTGYGRHPGDVVIAGRVSRLAAGESLSLMVSTLRL